MHDPPTMAPMITSTDAAVHHTRDPMVPAGPESSFAIDDDTGTAHRLRS